MGGHVSFVRPDEKSSRASLIGDSTDIKTGFCEADPITKRGQRVQIAQMVVIATLPMVILVIQIALSLADNVQRHTKASDAQAKVGIVDSLGDLITNVEKEHFESRVLMLNESATLDGLLKQFQETDRAIERLQEGPHFPATDSVAGNMSLEALRLDLGYKRSLLLNRRVSDDAIDDRLVHAVTWLWKSLSRAAKTADHSLIWRDILAYQLVMSAKSSYRTMLNDRSFQGDLASNVTSLQEFRKYSVIAQSCLEASTIYSKTARKLLTEDLATNKLYNVTKGLIRQILNGDGLSNVSRYWWERNMAAHLLTMDNIEMVIMLHLDEILSEDMSAGKRGIAYAATGLVVVVILTPVLLILICKMTLKIQNYASGLSLRTHEMKREKKKSDSLLYDMLPKSVALQLKHSKKVAPESYNAVTIYFSDIVGFTTMSARSSPMQVVEFLNKLYYVFDSAIDRHDVYKVETIGDAYMVASGLPQRNGKRHAGEIAALSLELVRAIQVFTIPHLPDEEVNIRIGLHTGPVIAGVVGTKMPRYCLFGETVNIASSMESAGVPMRIHVSAAFKEAIQKLNGWIIETRGYVEIKGQGEVRTYFLAGKESDRVVGSLRSVSTFSTVSRAPSRETPLLTLPPNGAVDI